MARLRRLKPEAPQKIENEMWQQQLLFKNTKAGINYFEGT